jgi:Trypsin
MRLLLILFTSIILAISCKNSSEREISLAKTVDTIYQSVVAILRVDSTGKTIMAGSGVLIHPNVILTAGHINYSNFTKWWDKNCLSIGYISFGNNAFQSTNRIPFNWLNDIVTHPDQVEFQKFISDTTQKSGPPELTDIGLIFLDQPILDKPIIKLPDHNLLSEIDKNDLLIGVGYGYHKVDTVYERIPNLVDGLRRKWQLSKISLDNDLWLSTYCDPETNLPYMGMFDSGAPLLLNDTIVVGIWGSMLEAPKPCLYLSAAARIDNSRILDWIKDCIKTRIGVDLN